MINLRVFFATLLFLFSTFVFSQEVEESQEVRPESIKDMTAVQLLGARDAVQHSSQYQLQLSMTISSSGFLNEKMLFVYGKDDLLLLEFTNPVDQGTKLLLSGSEVSVDFSDDDDLMIMPVDMALNDILGSDASIVDFLFFRQLADEYSWKLAGEALLEDQAVYILEGNLEDESSFPNYYRRKIWLDISAYNILRQELYDRRGKLLRTVQVVEFRKNQNGMIVPVKVEIRNHGRENTITTLSFLGVNLEAQLAENIFVLENDLILTDSE